MARGPEFEEPGIQMEELGRGPAAADDGEGGGPLAAAAEEAPPPGEAGYGIHDEVPPHPMGNAEPLEMGDGGAAPARARRFQERPGLLEKLTTNLTDLTMGTVRLLNNVVRFSADTITRGVLAVGHGIRAVLGGVVDGIGRQVTGFWANVEARAKTRQAARDLEKQQAKARQDLATKYTTLLTVGDRGDLRIYKQGNIGNRVENETTLAALENLLRDNQLSTLTDDEAAGIRATIEPRIFLMQIALGTADMASEAGIALQREFATMNDHTDYTPISSKEYG